MLTGNVHKTDALLSNSNTSVCGLISVQWHGEKWAISCLFEGNDLSQVIGPGDICTTKCDETPGNNKGNIILLVVNYLMLSGCFPKPKFTTKNDLKSSLYEVFHFLYLGN